MRSRLLRLAASLSLIALGACAAQAAPLKNADVDLAGVTAGNFYDVVVPVAKKEGRVTMYNFAGSFGDAWKELIRRFEEKYGIKVDYSDVQGDVANQQLIAVHRAGQDSPVDAYFTGGGNYPLLSSTGVIGDIALTRILPNFSKNYDPTLAHMAFGREHGGVFPLVHLNQTAIGYDSAVVAPKDVPTDFASFLAYAEAHPKTVGVTLPSKGGSGGGFIYSAALALTDAECRKQLSNTEQSLDDARDFAASAECLKPLWDYYARLLKVAELTNGNADTLNLINNRQLHVGTVWEDQVATFLQGNQLPQTMRLTLLAPGQVGSGDAFIVPANARNVAAALLLIDLSMDRDFQVWKLANKASRSPRTDISNADVTADVSAHRLPDAVYPKLSVPGFWDMSKALGEALDDKVLNQ